MDGKEDIYAFKDMASVKMVEIGLRGGKLLQKLNVYNLSSPKMLSRQVFVVSSYKADPGKAAKQLRSEN